MSVSDGLARSLAGVRSVDGERVTPVGWHAHSQGVETLLASFRQVPAGERVRLAKRTSNLFRKRVEPGAGLDVSGLGGVIAIDPVAKTADVQGMCTYEQLVDATLPFHLAPLVIPQLKTITLGGAVSGMGVESTSFRNGLPHESVIEMDVLTGTGDIVRCSREENVDLFRAFPNSYGSLGYAVRLKIELEYVAPYVELQHARFHSLRDFQEALSAVSASGSWDGRTVHGLDGVAFSPEEQYLVLAFQADDAPGASDYTRDAIFYRSLQHPEGITHDFLTIRDYIWRWDTDWFWCSRAFGTQRPKVRRFWPRELRRSAFYWKLVGLDKKYDLEYRFLKKPKNLPRTERVVQDIEVTDAHVAEFLDWFFQASEIEPVWLCPIRLRSDSAALSQLGLPEHAPWPLYPLEPGTTWVNVGFWSGVPADHVSPAQEPGAFNKVIERKVSELGGHKSLYSEAFYDRPEFERLYGGDLPERMKATYDPDRRFPGLFEKTVNNA
ncbi:FAD-binding oxidoreductase [Corynebacterium sp. NML180780]|uniref:FAD-binding oxidoreductase n=1 Tax=Corynebacterium sp. NML180780 TaxID=2598459 RepID=UPI001194F845|nr:FAD-binding oxidoreductase [Corynebacterium sp. NML180780]TVX77887.1 FAD-binding oxidoreductase [Corynebacterium sp. NML180780]